MIKYDFVVIGAGLFGIYASIDLNKKGYKVLLVDKAKFPYKKASIVNQARVHRGYHYPRSVTTALASNDFSERFIKDHENLINKEFSHFYGIDKFGSLTNANEFIRFANFLGLDYEEIKITEPFSNRRLEALFKVQEFSFDPFLLREFYLNILFEKKIETRYSTFIKSAEKGEESWKLNLINHDKKEIFVECANIINATYSSINEINQIFKFKKIEVITQLSEILFIYCEDFFSKGLTVMDGPYISIMPYGFSGIHSLTSVVYTHHNNFSNFRKKNNNLFIPKSNKEKLLKQLRNYFLNDFKIINHGSLFTYKTKLKSSHIDDSRPTNIYKLSEKPGYFQLFSGKISSIYEFENLWK